MIVRRVRRAAYGDEGGAGVLLPPDQSPDPLANILDAVPPVPSSAPGATDAGSPSNPYPSSDAAAAAQAQLDAEAAADQAVASLRSAYAQLRAAVSSTPSLARSAAQDQVAGQVTQLGPMIDQWATGRRQWAIDGTSGYVPYDWGKWVDEGKVFAGDIREYGADFRQGSAIGAAVDAASASFDQVVAVARAASGLINGGIGLLSQPWVWWVGGAAALGLVGLALYRNTAEAARELARRVSTPSREREGGA